MPHSLVESAAGVGFSCRQLTAYSEFRDAAALYTRVFEYTDRDYSLNPNLLSALARNGGSAVGAFAPDGALIGFAYGFAGRDARGEDFHYSQAAAVDPAHQGRGVGHALKFAQRDIARRWGQRSMRWTFDPLIARNAHFNLSSLGAVGIAFEPDYYGRPDTDRLVVSWDLSETADPYRAVREARPPVLTRTDWGTSTATDAARWIALPAAVASEERSSVRAAVGQALAASLNDGLVFVAAMRVDEETAAYLAVPRERKP